MSTGAYSLIDQVALVTGGGTGLGLGIAHAMVDAGARVLLAGRREESLRLAVESLGDSAEWVVADVTVATDRARMLAHCREHFGRPADILVNNAGQNMKRPALEVSDEDFDALLNTHVKAAFALSRDAAPAMIERGDGKILFIASMASYLGVPNIVGYTTAKTAVLGLTRALAAEWSSLGIRVNAIVPGWIETDMTRKALNEDPPRKQKVLSRTPMGRLGQPIDIGRAAVYLCSNAAAFVTGQEFPIDGGASIGF